jgi:site-specific DNA-methyltransferase (adenine-specific)
MAHSLKEALLSSQNMCWCTPKDLFERLNIEFGFTLDAAASEASAKCRKFYTNKEDGLLQDWGGEVVFCNPPYGQEIGKWVKKAHEESRKPGTVVVLLIPARTDTHYWHEYILHGEASEVRFLRGRLHFEDEDGNKGGRAPFPSAVVIYR